MVKNVITTILVISAISSYASIPIGCPAPEQIASCVSCDYTVRPDCQGLRTTGIEIPPTYNHGPMNSSFRFFGASIVSQQSEDRLSSSVAGNNVLILNCIYKDIPSNVEHTFQFDYGTKMNLLLKNCRFRDKNHADQVCYGAQVEDCILDCESVVPMSNSLIPGGSLSTSPSSVSASPSFPASSSSLASPPIAPIPPIAPQAVRSSPRPVATSPSSSRLSPVVSTRTVSFAPVPSSSSQSSSGSGSSLARATVPSSNLSSVPVPPFFLTVLDAICGVASYDNIQAFIRSSGLQECPDIIRAKIAFMPAIHHQAFYLWAKQVIGRREWLAEEQRKAQQLGESLDGAPVSSALPLPTLPSQAHSFSQSSNLSPSASSAVATRSELLVPSPQEKVKEVSSPPARQATSFSRTHSLPGNLPSSNPDSSSTSATAPSPRFDAVPPYFVARLEEICRILDFNEKQKFIESNGLEKCPMLLREKITKIVSNVCSEHLVQFFSWAKSEVALRVQRELALRSTLPQDPRSPRLVMGGSSVGLSPRPPTIPLLSLGSHSAPSPSSSSSHGARPPAPSSSSSQATRSPSASSSTDLTSITITKDSRFIDFTGMKDRFSHDMGAIQKFEQRLSSEDQKRINQTGQHGVSDYAKVFDAAYDMMDRLVVLEKLIGFAQFEDEDEDQLEEEKFTKKVLPVNLSGDALQTLFKRMNDRAAKLLRIYVQRQREGTSTPRPQKRKAAVQKSRGQDKLQEKK